MSSDSSSSRSIWRNKRIDNISNWRRTNSDIKSKTSLVEKLVYNELFPSSMSRSRNNELAATEKLVVSKLTLKNVFQSSSNNVPVNSAYGLQFSDDGRLLLSCHENGSIRGFDSRNQTLIFENEAHTDSCNGATFIDNSNSFASYSDDKSIKIWDFRNPHQVVKTIVGHTGWIKNVSVVPEKNQLISSAFDGFVRITDLKSPSEELDSKTVMSFPGLLRTQLTATGDSLILTTRSTYVYAISNLNLDTLATDYIKYFDSTRRHELIRNQVSRDKNVLGLVHYVPGIHDRCSGFSLDMHPNDDCCIVRHSRIARPPSMDQVNSREIYNPEHRSLEWVSVYDINNPGNTVKPLKEENDPSAEESSIYSSDVELDIPYNDDETDMYGKFLFDNTGGYNYEFVDFLNLSSRSGKFHLKIINKILLSSYNYNLTRYRMNMIFDSWINDTSQSACCPQDMNDVDFYRIIPERSPSIIKETSFSPSGRAIVTPSPLGFQILAFNEDVNSYLDCKANKQPTLGNAQELVILNEFKVPDHPCFCVKFSPVEGHLIVAGDQAGNISWFLM